MKNFLTNTFIPSLIIFSLLAISTACSTDQKVEQKVKQEVTPKATAVVKADTAYAKGGSGYSHTGDTVISGIRLIDGLGNEPVKNQDIVVVGGKIAAIGPAGSVKVPADALKIDGKGLTAMPGLMDLHIHTSGGWANGLIPGERYKVPRDDASIQQRMSGYVYAGVTTVLDVGADHKWVLNKRKQINSGEMFGPRR